MKNTQTDITSYENAWLGLTEEDSKSFDKPLSNLSDYDKNNLHLYILKKMRDPEYFHWTVKTLFNVDLLPIQTCILRELWKRPFPMYQYYKAFAQILAAHAEM